MKNKKTLKLAILFIGLLLIVPLIFAQTMQPNPQNLGTIQQNQGNIQPTQQTLEPQNNPQELVLVTVGNAKVPFTNEQLLTNQSGTTGSSNNNGQNNGQVFTNNPPNICDLVPTTLLGLSVGTAKTVTVSCDRQTCNNTHWIVYKINPNGQAQLADSRLTVTPLPDGTSASVLASAPISQDEGFALSVLGSDNSGPTGLCPTCTGNRFFCGTDKISAQVNSNDLSVALTTTQEVFKAGQQVLGAITVKNLGNQEATNVVVNYSFKKTAGATGEAVPTALAQGPLDFGTVPPATSITVPSSNSIGPMVQFPVITPSEPGVYEFTVEVSPQTGETSSSNNSDVKYVTVRGAEVTTAVPEINPFLAIITALIIVGIIAKSKKN